MAPGVSSFPKKVVVTRAGIFRNVMGLIAKVLKQKGWNCNICFNYRLGKSKMKRKA